MQHAFSFRMFGAAVVAVSVLSITACSGDQPALPHDRAAPRLEAAGVAASSQPVADGTTTTTTATPPDSAAAERGPGTIGSGH